MLLKMHVVETIHVVEQSMLLNKHVIAKFMLLTGKVHVVEKQRCSTIYFVHHSILLQNTCWRKLNVAAQCMLWTNPCCENICCSQIHVGEESCLWPRLQRNDLGSLKQLQGALPLLTFWDC